MLIGTALVVFLPKNKIYDHSHHNIPMCPSVNEPFKTLLHLICYPLSYSSLPTWLKLGCLFRKFHLLYFVDIHIYTSPLTYVHLSSQYSCNFKNINVSLSTKNLLSLSKKRSCSCMHFEAFQMQTTMKTHTCMFCSFKQVCFVFLI